MEEVSFNVKKNYNCDVAVVGGGVGGFAAAVSAARQGQSVILIENGGFLGGTATKGLVGPFMTCYDSKGEEVILRGLFAEFVDRMVKDGGAISYRDCKGGTSYAGYRDRGHIGVTPFDAECFKRISEEMCLEAGVKLFYHTSLIGCKSNEGKIECLYAAGVSGILRINAKMYVDATGSATLADMAGALTFRGDENGFLQSASLFFRIDGVNKAELDKHMAENRDMRRRFYMDEIKNARLCGEFPCGTLKLRIYEAPNGFWTVNMAQVDDTLNELDTETVTQAEISQRKQVKQIVDFLKKTVPALKNIRLVDSASDIGIRESRRIIGRHIFCLEDIQNHKYFEDRIAVCANSVDIHMKDRVEYTAYDGGNYYIPLSAAMSKNITNLFAAGKCISADKFAHAAVRVMPPCIAVGEAVGVCAALASKKKIKHYEVNVTDVQNIITKNGGYIG